MKQNNDNRINVNNISVGVDAHGDPCKKHRFNTSNVVASRVSARGITLIALVITIIILLILAGVALTLTIGENGIINHAKTSKEAHEKAAEREQLELVLYDARMEKEINREYNETEFLNNFIREKITTARINDDEIGVKKYTYLIDREELKIISEVESDSTEEPTPEEPIPGLGLIQKITEMSTNGNYEIEVNGKKKITQKKQ